MKRLLVLLACVVMLAACSSKEGAGEELVAYKDDVGTVMIPKEPKRVVILNNSLAGYPFALDEKPVGLTDFALGNTHFAPYIEGIEDVGDGSLEKVLALNPDLIIAFPDVKNLAELEKIAPVVSYAYGKRDFREQLLEVGKLFNKEQQAKDWLKDFDARIAADKPAIQEKMTDQTVAILSVGEKSMYAYSDRWARGGEIIYGEFGIAAPEAVQKQAIEGDGWAELSLEKITDFAGDYIFLEEGPEIDGLKQLAIWQSLDAVKNNRIYMLKSSDSYFNDPISLEGQRQFIVTQLLQQEA